MGVFGVLIRNLKHVKGPGYHSFKSVVNRKKKNVNCKTNMSTPQLGSIHVMTMPESPFIHVYTSYKMVPPSYVVGWFWPHELFWCVYHKASQSLDWLLVNKRTVASVMRCHEMSWVNCTFQLLLVKCQLIVVNWPAGAPIWSAAWFFHRKLRPPSREMFRLRSGWRWNDGAETWRTWGTWAIC